MLKAAKSYSNLDLYVENQLPFWKYIEAEFWSGMDVSTIDANSCPAANINK